jgi:hypothetical protein
MGLYQHILVYVYFPITQNIISVISKSIDLFVVFIIGISALQTIISAIASVYKIHGKEKAILL